MLRVAAAATALLAAPACALLVGDVDGDLSVDSGVVHEGGTRESGLHDVSVRDGVTQESSGLHEAAGGDASSRDATGEGAVPRDAAVDAANHDASPGDATVDGPVNLLPNPGFENGIVAMDCGEGWSIRMGGNLTTSSIARSGKASCLVCPTVRTAPAVLVSSAPAIVVPEAGPFVVATAYIRGVADAGAADGSEPSARVFIYQVEPNDTNISTVGATTTPSPSAWVSAAPAQVQATYTGNDTFVWELYIQGGCVLVDDVGFYLQ